MKTKLATIILLIISLILLNLFGSKAYKRFDLTHDKRYTLSETTKIILEKIETPLIVKVYLQGSFPAEFKRLQIETKLHLEELNKENKNIRFKFIDPSEIGQTLIENGLEPSRLQIEENGTLSEIVIFPWAVVSYKNKIEKIPLLKDIFSNSQDEQLQSSIQNLEFAFTDAIHKVSAKKEKKIAILKGNGELEDIYIADFLMKLSEYYHIAPFTLDSIKENPVKTLEHLTTFDLAIIAKPTEKFSEKEKYALDQYLLHGGKTLWLVDETVAELDSLTNTGESLVYRRDLGLTDLFFNYGIRINSNLIRDSYSSQIPLATGNIGNKTQFNTFNWSYFPLVNSLNNHAINNNIEAVSFKFSNSIDTLRNNIKKTVLLQSSDLSLQEGTPKIISLKSITEKINSSTSNFGNYPLAVLLQGQFKSAYSERIKPFKYANSLDVSKTTNEMIVISDGDVIANEISKGQPLELGVDKWTNQKFGNKEFLLNAVNYLLDNSGLINIRSKQIKINFLDKEKAYSEAFKWQVLNIILPLIILGLFGFIFNFFRKKKYQ